MWSLLLLIAASLPLLAATDEGPTNLIVLVADGLGPAGQTLARMLTDELALDEIVVGIASTEASNSRVADSAAAATALACGVTTFVGALGVDPQGRPVGNLFEAAAARGLATGVVTNTQISHATPGAFSAHVVSRERHADIVDQQLAGSVDVLLGGGWNYWIPVSVEGSTRIDERDMLEAAAEAGFGIVTTAAGLADASLPLIGLFGPWHLDFEIDRDGQPSLADMTAKAIELLSSQPDGFVLMIESGRIDHAGHLNDPVAWAHEIAHYDEVVRSVLDFARENGETLVVTLADHETGGATLGRDVAGTLTLPDPELLLSARHSLGFSATAIVQGDVDRKTVITEWLAVDDVTAAELERIDLATGRGRVAVRDELSDIISARAGIGWTTRGHTAVDVLVGADGPGAHRFVGYHSLAEVGVLLAEVMGVDLAAETERLQSGS